MNRADRRVDDPFDDEREAIDDAHLWAKSYTRKLSDALQSDVARDIADEIWVELTSAEERRFDSRGSR